MQHTSAQADKLVNTEKKIPHLPEEDSRLRAICLARMKKESGGDPAPEIARRLEEELTAVSELGMCGVMLILHELFARSGLPRYLISCRGTLCASYVAWLCGLTPFDPLKAQLPLYPEFFFGRPTARNKVLTAAMEINVPFGTADSLFALLKTIEGVGDVVPMLDSSGSVNPIKHCIIPAGIEADPKGLTVGESPYFELCLLEAKLQTLLAKLEAETGISPEGIELEDREVLELFRNATHPADPDCLPDPLSVIGLSDPFVLLSQENRRKAYFQPESFADLVRIDALRHSTGVWKNNQEELVRAGKASLADLICCREDVYEFCRDHLSLSADDAFCVAERARMGHGVSGQWQAEIPGEAARDFFRLQDICDRIEYLFTRAHCYAFMLTVWRCAWYRVHHPEAFYRALFHYDTGGTT